MFYLYFGFEKTPWGLACGQGWLLVMLGAPYVVPRLLTRPGELQGKCNIIVFLWLNCFLVVIIYIFFLSFQYLHIDMPWISAYWSCRLPLNYRSKSIMRYYLTQVRLECIKIIKTTSIGMDAEKKKPSSFAGVSTGSTSLETIWTLLTKTKNWTYECFNNSNSLHLPPWDQNLCFKEIFEFLCSLQH